MDNRLRFTVSAVDKATSVIKRINKSIGQLTRPVNSVGSAFESLSKQMGLDKVGDGLKDIGSIAQKAVGSMSTMPSVLSTIVGAGSIGGIAALANSWGTLGIETAYAAQNIGISAGKLQTWQRVAALAGVESQAMTGGLTSLGSIMNDARWGRNNQALAMMNMLGLKFRRTADGALDVQNTLEDLSRVIVSKNGNPQTQSMIASTFGVEGLLPLLRQGPDALRAYREELAVLGEKSEDLIDKEKRLGFSINRFGSALVGVGNVIEGGFIPRIQPLIDGSSSWISKNRAMVAVLGEMATAFTVVGAAARVIPFMLSLLNPFSATIAAIAAASVLICENWEKLSKIPTALSLFAKTGVYVLSGKNKAVAASMASDINTLFAGNVSKSLGIRQNNPGNLRSWSGVESVNGYARFATPEAGLSAAAKNLLAFQDTHGIRTINGIVNRWAPSSDGNNTAAYAADVSKETGFAPNQNLDLHDSKTLSSLLSAIVRHENGQNPYSQDQINAAVNARLSEGQGKDVHVKVSFDNAPNGTKATATTGGGAFLPTRVEYAMPSYVIP